MQAEPILLTARERTRALTFYSLLHARGRARLHSELGGAPARAGTRRAYIPNSVPLLHARGRVAPTFRTRWRSCTREDARAYIPNSVALPHARGRDAPTFYSLPHARGRDAPTSLPIAMDTRRPPELALDGRGSESRTRLWLRYLLPVEARGQRIRAARPGRSGPMHD